MRNKSLIAAVLLCTLMSSLHAQGNYALSFDGSDDYVSIPDNDALDIGTSDFSIQFWIKSMIIIEL